MKKVSIIILILLVVGILGYFVYLRYFKTQVTELKPTEKEALKLDSEKEQTYLSKAGPTKGVYWVRAFDLTWNEIEPKKGELDWSFTDERVKEFNQSEIYPLVIVKPFANWDQDTCHPEEKYKAETHVPEGEKLKIGKPCDMTAYAEFLEKAVERYDGDGQDDMPGLSIPIKYWEIMNEPSMQGGVTGGMGEELKFFVGTSKEYLEILKTSYQTIKKVDPKAKVLHAGMAGMQQNFVDFWEPILSAQGGNYFDIANIHTISTDQKREDLYMIKFKKFLEKYGLDKKPIWITEVQFGSLTERPPDLEAFDKLLVRSSVFSLALGADKLFYVENWIHWDEGLKEEPKEEKEPKKMKEIKDNPTHEVYLNLVRKINSFDKIEKIKEEYVENPHDSDGATSKVGQYKFIKGNKAIYVLWGKAELPSEISGQVKVTDIYGKSQTMNASQIELSDSPMFIE